MPEYVGAGGVSLGHTTHLDFNKNHGANGRFSSGGGGAGGGGGGGGGNTTAAGLQAQLVKLRGQSFMAAGTPKSAAIHAKIKKTEGRIAAHAAESATNKSLRSRLFTAPKGSALHKRLEKEVEASTTKMANI